MRLISESDLDIDTEFKDHRVCMLRIWGLNKILKIIKEKGEIVEEDFKVLLEDASVWWKFLRLKGVVKVFQEMIARHRCVKN